MRSVTITGSSASAASLRRRRKNSKPFIPGILRSSRITSGRCSIEALKCVLAVGRDPKTIARTRQELAHKIVGHLFVIDQQHLRERTAPGHAVENIDQPFAIHRLREVFVGAEMCRLAILAGG